MTFDRKAYYQKTRERQLETAAKWRKENKERHCASTIASTKGRRFRDPVGYLLEQARARAKRNEVAFELTREDIVIPDTCPVLGIPLQFNEWTGDRSVKNPNAPSIDRIDSSKGYIPGNILICSWRANQLKSNGTPDEFHKLATFLLSWQSG